MSSDDVFATEQPFEMNPNETVLKQAILNAIRRRSLFIYLRPTNASLKRLGYFVDIQLEFANFEATLFPAFQKSEKKSYAGHLVLIQADNVPLFVLQDCKWDIFLVIALKRPTVRSPASALPPVSIRTAAAPIFAFRFPLIQQSAFSSKS
jgi:hypothetical protein